MLVLLSLAKILAVNSLFSVRPFGVFRQEYKKHYAIQQCRSVSMQKPMKATIQELLAALSEDDFINKLLDYHINK